MYAPNRFTRLKMVSSYIVLVAVLVVSIGYIYQKMRDLTARGDDETLISRQRQVTNEIMSHLYNAEVMGQSLTIGEIKQLEGYKSIMRQAKSGIDSLRVLLNDSLSLSRLDSVEVLLVEKEKNMLNLLGVIKGGGTSEFYQKQINQLIARQDSLLHLPVLQKKIKTQTDTYVVHNKPKGFFKRLEAVFSPGKGDSTRVKKVIQEVAVDSMAVAYNPTDTVVNMLNDISMRLNDVRQRQTYSFNNAIQMLRLNGLEIGRKVNQLLKDIEARERILAETLSDKEDSVRRSSIKIISGIAVVAIILSGVFLVLIWRDISRSNRYRKELEQSKRRAENLLAIREQLMLTITHDIKAPTGSILGHIDLMERIVADPRQCHYLENMRGSATHLLNLVNALMDYHRLDSKKMSVSLVAFNPYQLFGSIYSSFLPLADGKRLALEYNCENELDDNYSGDPFRIRQIAENLLSNALKFTTSGFISLRVGISDGSLCFKISDTGCGIKEEDLLLIFKEFTRLPNAQGQEGFGLGLSITQKLTELLGGILEVESKEGSGSTFSVSIPVTKITNYENCGLAQRSSATGPIRVVLIDDDSLQLQLTAAMLEHPDIKVLCCDNRDDLFAILKETKNDVLLTDIQMPEMNGFDLLREISRSGILIPVIAVTARSDMDDNYLRINGFAGCLHKPFSLESLYEEISRVISKGVKPVGRYSLPQAKADDKFDFSALTAFSGDDGESAKEIIGTFISETRNNRDLMIKALEDNCFEEISMLAHKMLPLFTMIEAAKLLPSLIYLDQRRDVDGMTKEIVAHANIVIKETANILIVAQFYRDELDEKTGES